MFGGIFLFDQERGRDRNLEAKEPCETRPCGTVMFWKVVVIQWKPSQNQPQNHWFQHLFSHVLFYGFPWFSHVFSMGFHGFPMFRSMVFHGFPMFFPWVSMVFPCFVLCFPWFSHDNHVFFLNNRLIHPDDHFYWEKPWEFSQLLVVRCGAGKSIG